MFEIFLALILLFLLPKKEYHIKAQQYPKSRRFGWRRLPLLTTLWWKLRYYLFRIKTAVTFNSPADFIFTSTADWDAGLKTNTTTITDDYEGATDAIKLSSPPRKKDANDKGVWLMSESTGDVVADSSGNGNHGTAYGATITTSGKFGNARSFDGTDDKIHLPETDGLPTLADGSFSMTARAKVTNANTARNIIRRDNYHNQGAENRRVACMSILGTSGFVIMGIYDGTYDGNAYGTTNTADGAWHFLVGTYDFAAKTSYIYVDGALEDSTVVTAMGNFNTAREPWVIGAINSITLNQEMMLGTIDDVRMYNRVLSAPEITALYNSGLQYVTSGNWKSATKTIASDEKLKVLTVSHTGLSGTYSIQYKILKSSDGSVLWSSLVLTSGTTEHWHESDFGIITDEGIQIQRIFAGDGVGTAVGGRIDGICTGIENLRCIDVNMKDVYVKV